MQGHFTMRNGMNAGGSVYHRRATCMHVTSCTIGQHCMQCSPMTERRSPLVVGASATHVICRSTPPEWQTYEHWSKTACLWSRYVLLLYHRGRVGTWTVDARQLEPDHCLEAPGCGQKAQDIQFMARPSNSLRGTPCPNKPIASTQQYRLAQL